MPHQLVSSGTTTEKTFGYSRAVRAGNMVCVAGTTAMAPAGPVGGADVYEQTREVLTRIRVALEETGATLHDVTRTRVYVTAISSWPEVGRAHRETFGDVLPASTIVEVSALFDPRLLVEIEATAVLG